MMHQNIIPFSGHTCTSDETSGHKVTTCTLKAAAGLAYDACPDYLTIDGHDSLSCGSQSQTTNVIPPDATEGRTRAGLTTLRDLANPRIYPETFELTEDRANI